MIKEQVKIGMAVQVVSQPNRQAIPVSEFGVIFAGTPAPTHVIYQPWGRRVGKTYLLTSLIDEKRADLELAPHQQIPPSDGRDRKIWAPLEWLEPAETEGPPLVRAGWEKYLVCCGGEGQHRAFGCPVAKAELPKKN